MDAYSKAPQTELGAGTRQSGQPETRAGLVARQSISLPIICSSPGGRGASRSVCGNPSCSGGAVVRRERLDTHPVDGG